MQRAEIQIGGTTMKVCFQKIGTRLWMHFDGRTLSVDLVEKRRGAGAADDAVAAGHIKAPMPGKILKVLVKEGDTVAAESTLVVMEAMKMEYSLAAPVASRVKAIKCKEGQQVALSHVLVELEPAT